MRYRYNAGTTPVRCLHMGVTNIIHIHSVRMTGINYGTMPVRYRPACDREQDTYDLYLYSVHMTGRLQVRYRYDTGTTPVWYLQVRMTCIIYIFTRYT